MLWNKENKSIKKIQTTTSTQEVQEIYSAFACTNQTAKFQLNAHTVTPAVQADTLRIIENKLGYTHPENVFLL